MSRPVITIDGPSGAGKTTAAVRFAEAAGLLRLDTGAMYRACALAAKRAGVPWSDARRLGVLCAGLALAFVPGPGGIRLTLSGEDVTEAIRTPEIGMGASDVSVHPSVREAMVALQRKIGEGGGVVADGRDAGTVVFPGADAKFFLDALAAVRARRRFLEWDEGARPPFEEVLRDVLRRDVQDCTRDHSPLRIPPGAVYLDTTAMTPAEVVRAMLAAFSPGLRARIGGAGA